MVLVVDDEPAIQHAFRKAFKSQDLTLKATTTAAEAIQEAQKERPDLIVLDVHLPDATGLQTFQQLRAIDARIPIILVTGHGTTDLAIEAMKQGAFEYLLKPLELNQLRELIDRALRSSRLMRTPAGLPADPIAIDPQSALGDSLIGNCPAMQNVYKSIGRVAQQDATVLILGQSGTGKELVARALYQHSKRREKPFLAINCGAIPENLLESELFGHERGAFTGADRKRIGKFEQCSGGTIFLDEIGELPLSAQVKMLRLIQEQQFERVGGNETVRTDVRLIAATNADLEQLCDEGLFRKDLFFRLNVFTISLPPLRERGDDIRSLIEYYIRRFGREMGKVVEEIDPAAIEVLRNYSWPGNVRELQSVVKQALLLVSAGVLLADFLPSHVFMKGAQTQPAGTVESGSSVEGYWDEFVSKRIAEGSETLYAESVERMERELLVRVLRHTGGNQVQTARILGITRGSVRNKIKQLGITLSRAVCAEDEQDES
jgi:two-component system nitrogen regulation response regulator GlnG